MHAFARWLLAGLRFPARGRRCGFRQWRRSPRRSEKPGVKPVRSIPYVSITGDDGKQRHYETNAIPLLFNRACFGWRMYLGGPNRVVSLEGGADDLAACRAGDRRSRDRGQRRQDASHHSHVRDRAGRRAAALLVHHPGRSAGHLHLRHHDRRRAARRVRVLRHRSAGPESSTPIRATSPAPTSSTRVERAPAAGPVKAS